jgi:hypothetical protein
MYETSVSILRWDSIYVAYWSLCIQPRYERRDFSKWFNLSLEVIDAEYVNILHLIVELKENLLNISLGVNARATSFFKKRMM